MINKMKKNKRMSIGNYKLKVVSKLSKLFEPTDYPISFTELQKVKTDKNIKTIMLMDKCTVVGVSPKTELAEKILCNFIDKENTTNLTRLIDYKPNDTDGSSKFSLDYLTKIINILKIGQEAVQISTAVDYLGIFENKHFKFSLAPRVDEY